MAAYGTLVAWAQAMGHTDAARLLQQTLDEEKPPTTKPSGLAEAGSIRVRLTPRTRTRTTNWSAPPALRGRARRGPVAGRRPVSGAMVLIQLLLPTSDPTNGDGVASPR